MELGVSLLQISESVLVAQSCPTLCNPMACSLPGSSSPWNSPVFCLFFFPSQAIWTASGILVPPPRIEPRPPALGAWSPNHWATRELPPCSCLSASLILGAELCPLRGRVLPSLLDLRVDFSVCSSFLLIIRIDWCLPNLPAKPGVAVFKHTHTFCDCVLFYHIDVIIYFINYLF